MPDKDELLMWRILGKLESLALRQYESWFPQLATAEKKEIVSQLLKAAPDDVELEASLLGQPVKELLDAASNPDKNSALIVQGFVLERLGQIIYKALSAHHHVSDATRSVASAGWGACETVIGLATQQIRKQIGEGDRVFQAFCTAADGVLKRLDGLGEGVDHLFGQRFGLTFSEVLGDFTAELLPACVDIWASAGVNSCVTWPAFSWDSEFMRHPRGGATLVTGATGFLGGLIAAKLLAEESRNLVLPVRARHTPEAVLQRLIAEVGATGAPITSDLASRVTVLTLPENDDIHALAPQLRGLGVDQIIHAAGCVDYFHSGNLAQGNTDLTRAVVELGQALRVDRFEFISSAFSSGYSHDTILETPHADSADDPTEYTKSKREAERCVIASGLPWVIHRPSVVIGDSRDGRYVGKSYGLYQLWKAAEKLLCVQYLERIYAIAPRTCLHVVHQDAFQNGFLAAHRTLPAGSIIHLISRPDSLPTARDIWDEWLMKIARPREIYYFERLADVPMEKLTRQQQVWVELTAVNLDISTHPWNFETTALDRLRAAGLPFADATPETISVCQNRFVADSPRVQTFLEKFRAERAAEPSIIEC